MSLTELWEGLRRGPDVVTAALGGAVREKVDLVSSAANNAEVHARHPWSIRETYSRTKGKR
jgi:hypothetical protein